MRDDFAIFILTHGRPEFVKTIRTLDEFKYTGRVYLILDDEDQTAEGYRKRFGAERVLTFSKAEIGETFDIADNFPGRNSVVYARNACWKLARDLGLRYFAQFEDDYSGFYVRTNSRGEYGSFRAEFLDEALEGMIDYLAASPALSIAMSQGGDHIGGFKTKMTLRHRKIMNTWICDVERPFKFVGRMNDDVNTYVSLGRQGAFFLTIPVIQVNQAQTQAHEGGHTDMYRQYGTHVKSFYSVMMCPSAVRIGRLKVHQERIHHSINWRAACAQIVPERFRKPDKKKPPRRAARSA